MANSKLKTPVLQVSFIIYFLIPIRIQKRLKDTFSYVGGNKESQHKVYLKGSLGSRTM